MAYLMDHSDTGADAVAGECDVGEQVLAAAEAFRQRGLAVACEDQEILLEPQPPIPSLAAAPGNQVGAAVETIPDQHRLGARGDRKSTRLNSSHANISYAVFCLKKKNKSG